MSPLAGAVLVGGQSRRMGRDKALVPVDGAPMAQRVAAVLDAAGVAEVAFVGGADRGLGRRHVADQFPGEGPLGGVVTALGALDGDLVIVVACDLPWLDTGTLNRLVDGLGTADVAFACTDRREPMCALWRRARALPVLTASFAAGERAIHRALDGLVVVDVTVEARPLTNVNTPDDLGPAPGDEGDAPRPCG